MFQVWGWGCRQSRRLGQQPRKKEAKKLKKEAKKVKKETKESKKKVEPGEKVKKETKKEAKSDLVAYPVPFLLLLSGFPYTVTTPKRALP